MGFLLIFHTALKVLSQKVHWVHNNDQLKSTSVGLSGSGKNHFSSTNNSGYIEYDFPTDLPSGQVRCNFSTGLQHWKGGVFNDTCYKNTNSSINYNSSLILSSSLIGISYLWEWDLPSSGVAYLNYTLTPQQSNYSLSKAWMMGLGPQ